MIFTPALATHTQATRWLSGLAEIPLTVHNSNCPAVGATRRGMLTASLINPQTYCPGPSAQRPPLGGSRDDLQSPVLHSIRVEDFADWREKARGLLNAGVRPDDVAFVTGDDLLLPADDAAPGGRPRPLTIPKSFLELARSIACHSNPARYDRLYRVLWRLAEGERQLMQDAADADVVQLRTMEKSVRRDLHKLKAFVRFRKTTDDAGEEHFVAWHRPDHTILTLGGDFFARRFSDMRWTILTPRESATYDLRRVTYGPGVPRSEAPRDDELEELWKTYYANIFNPARIKLNAMRAEMPMKHWSTMPETALIPDLLRNASKRVDTMIKTAEGQAVTAADFIPADAPLSELAQAATFCEGCDLYKDATQVVFGEGPADARLVFVGEQPGDQEDLAGHPFVGPAGQLFNEMLKEAGLERSQAYVTNTVKHFKWEPKGNRRLHKKPSAREIASCKPWVEREIAEIKPEVVVCLGATAAQALIGKHFKITKDRGSFVASDVCERTIATYHPSAILRVPDADQKASMRAAFVTDLRTVRDTLA